MSCRALGCTNRPSMQPSLHFFRSRDRRDSAMARVPTSPTSSLQPGSGADPLLKEALHGRRFTSDDEVKEAGLTWLREQAKNVFSAGIQELNERYDKCFVFHGDYVENFPSAEQDTGRLMKWLANMRRQDWKPTKSARLCSLHFEDQAFTTDSKGNRRLKNTAVPTLFTFPNHLVKKPCYRSKQRGMRGREQPKMCKPYGDVYVSKYNEHRHHFESLTTLKGKNDIASEEYRKSMKLEQQKISGLKKAGTAFKKVQGAQKQAVDIRVRPLVRYQSIL